MADASAIPPEEAKDNVRTFPAWAVQRALPRNDRVTVFHEGRAVTFDTPEDLHEAVLRSREPELRSKLNMVEAALIVCRTARDQARAEAEANAVRLRKVQAECQEAVVGYFLSGLAIGAVLIILLGLGG